MTGRGDVFIHAMWRTGSTFLTSRFREADGYLDFYEPFHEAISRLDRSSGRVRRRRQEQAARQEALNHPRLSHGYFLNYNAPVPGQDKPLCALHCNRYGMGDVYRALSPAAAQYLGAASRLAHHADQIAAFGFCRSGLQVTEMARRLEGEHIYLYREPRSQFASYKPGENDYFMPMTLVQLLGADRLRPVLKPVLPKLMASGLVRRMSRGGLSPRLTLKIARPQVAKLPANDLYRLFYTSWLVSNEAGRRACQERLSLTGLASDPRQKRRLEDRLGITLSQLTRTPQRLAPFEVDYRQIERDVESRLSRHAESVFG